MRLDEINRSNKVWAKLKGVNVDVIDEYNSVIILLKQLIHLNSPYRTSVFIGTITEFEDVIIDFINADYTGYPDQNDIKEFKFKCNKMLTNIQYLKSQLP